MHIIYIHCVLILITSKSKDLFECLLSHDINLQVHYIPVHTQPYYKKYNYNVGDYPVSEKFYLQELLPIYPSLSESDQSYNQGDQKVLC